MPVTACWAATLWSVAAVRNWSGTQMPKTMMNSAQRYRPLKRSKPGLSFRRGLRAVASLTVATSNPLTYFACGTHSSGG